MLPVIECESTFTQFDRNGRVLSHVNDNGSIDYGLYQINSSHLEEAKKMGINIFSVEGNTKFAKYLLGTKRGIKHWSCAK